MWGYLIGCLILIPVLRLIYSFFTKDESTKNIWFYEHPYPPGYKSYSKTKPIKIEEFAAEKAWWNNREENEFAWCVSIEEIKANGYNLDIKNPYQ